MMQANIQADIAAFQIQNKSGVFSYRTSPHLLIADLQFSYTVLPLQSESISHGINQKNYSQIACTLQKSIEKQLRMTRCGIIVIIEGSIQMSIFASYQYYSEIKMPFKLKLIKEFQKNFRSMKDHEESTDKLEVVKDEHNQQKQRSRQKKKLIFKNYSMFQLIINKEPTDSQHVTNFYNIFAINQQAIRDPAFDQSLFSTVFYIKNVKKVEVKPNLVILHMMNMPFRSPPLQYIIERFKSFGDQRFYNLANIINEAYKRMKAINQIQVNQNIEESNDFLQKYIEQMGNKLYYCRASVNKMVFSRSLLELLQYNVQDFALDCIRYKACLTEFVSAQPYFDVAFKMMENIRNLFDLLSDKISLQAFLDSSIIRFKDFMYTKNNKKLYCKLKVGMPNPMISLFEIEEVINRSEDIPNSNSISKKTKIEVLKKERELAEISHIRNVIPLPKNLLPENEKLVTRYRNGALHQGEPFEVISQ